MQGNAGKYGTAGLQDVTVSRKSFIPVFKTQNPQRFSVQPTLALCLSSPYHSIPIQKASVSNLFANNLANAVLWNLRQKGKHKQIPVSVLYIN